MSCWKNGLYLSCVYHSYFYTLFCCALPQSFWEMKCWSYFPDNFLKRLFAAIIYFQKYFNFSIFSKSVELVKWDVFCWFVEREGKWTLKQKKRKKTMIQSIFILATSLTDSHLNCIALQKKKKNQSLKKGWNVMCIVLRFFFNEKIPLKPGIPFRDLFVETHMDMSFRVCSLLIRFLALNKNGHW